MDSAAQQAEIMTKVVRKIDCTTGNRLQQQHLAQAKTEANIENSMLTGDREQGRRCNSLQGIYYNLHYETEHIGTRRYYF